MVYESQMGAILNSFMPIPGGSGNIIDFFKNMNIENLYDWYIFIDDDTFVFHNRLIKLLENYNSNENYYIGKILDLIKLRSKSIFWLLSSSIHFSLCCFA